MVENTTSYRGTDRDFPGIRALAFQEALLDLDFDPVLEDLAWELADLHSTFANA
jgi:hypothetical protein